jgi:hypothetical protein
LNIDSTISEAQSVASEFVNLIFKNRRLCGYDSEGGRTHIHPIDAPESHIFTDKKVGVKEFTVKALKLLEEREML